MIDPLTACLALGISYLVVYYYQKMKRGVCKSQADLTGKTVLITGANAGIGYHTTLDLATRNARVIMACRNLAKGELALQKIREETGNTNLILYELDVSSLKSVRNFADQINRNERWIDILINNAGCTGLPFQQTDEGFETIFVTNHFGPFLLTNLLLDKVKTSPAGRIVFVSSIAHKWGKLDPDNMNSEKKFDKVNIYFHSKMANVMTARELAKKLEGTGVTVNSLHPGSIRTDLLQHLPWPARIFMNILAYLFFRTPEEGAQCSIYCAVAEELEGVTGKYFEECHIAKEGKQARDDGLCKKVWEVSENLVGL